jgi:GT2 family glycosyltransferase
MKNISFIINTSVNTRDHIELLMKSLRDNLDEKEHEILVFIDSDNEDVYGYLKNLKKDFFDLKIITHKLNPCVGYARNNNLLVELAKHDIVSYLQSDMVIGPHYDTNVLSYLEENCILSATRVEPPLHGYSDYTITQDFGTDPTVFDMERWNKYSESIKSNRSAEYFFAPITFYKKVWQSIGGYDTRFRRSREDSDLVQRCIHAGIKLLQTWEANVYHFTCVSSRGKNWFDPNSQEAKKRVELQKIADGIELRRFIKKWGNFNHGQVKLNKLDIDLVIKSDMKISPMFLVQIEPFFSRVWLQTKEDKKLVVDLYSTEHDVANELLKFSKEDWEVSKKFFSITDYNQVYQIGEPQNYNIKIDLNFSSIVDPGKDLFLSNLTRLGDIIEPSEPGIYELGAARINVLNVVSLAQDQVVVQNPPFDMNLLTIE